MAITKGKAVAVGVTTTGVTAATTTAVVMSSSAEEVKPEPQPKIKEEKTTTEEKGYTVTFTASADPQGSEYGIKGVEAGVTKITLESQKPAEYWNKKSSKEWQAKAEQHWSEFTTVGKTDYNSQAYKWAHDKGTYLKSSCSWFRGNGKRQDFIDAYCLPEETE